MKTSNQYFTKASDYQVDIMGVFVKFILDNVIGTSHRSDILEEIEEYSFLEGVWRSNYTILYTQYANISVLLHAQRSLPSQRY